MSVAMYLVFDRAEPGFDARVRGTALATSSEELGALAERLGVTPLMDFFSMKPHEIEDVARAFEMPVEDVASVAGEETWFSPDDGLRTVTTLIAHLEREPLSLRNGSAVLEDLSELESVLAHARDAGLKWHLAVDY